MLPTLDVIRFKVLRALVIIVIAANVALATRILPAPKPRAAVPDASLSGLVAGANQQYLGDVRTLLVTLYDTYHARRLTITPQAVDYLGTAPRTAHFFRQFARIPDVQTMPRERFPSNLDEGQPVLSTVDFAWSEAPRIAVLRAPLPGVGSDTIYAYMHEGQVVFVPQPAAE